MPRHFFTCRIGSAAVEDLEGSELQDLAAARVEAMVNARDLMSGAIRDGFEISHRTYEICDEDGAVVETLSFADAVTRQD